MYNKSFKLLVVYIGKEIKILFFKQNRMFKTYSCEIYSVEHLQVKGNFSSITRSPVDSEP